MEGLTRGDLKVIYDIVAWRGWGLAKLNSPIFWTIYILWDPDRKMAQLFGLNIGVFEGG